MVVSESARRAFAEEVSTLLRCNEAGSFPAGREDRGSSLDEVEASVRWSLDDSLVSDFTFFGVSLTGVRDGDLLGARSALCSFTERVSVLERCNLASSLTDDLAGALRSGVTAGDSDFGCCVFNRSAVGALGGRCCRGESPVLAGRRCGVV